MDFESREYPKRQGLYRIFKDADSLTVVTNGSFPVLNLVEGEKSDFQKIHNGQEPDVALLKKLVDGGVATDVEDVKTKVFTIGLGTNLILREDVSGSLAIPMVRRTQTADSGGAPNLGKTSRAAGGSTADIGESGLREFYEECFCVAKVNGEAKLLRFVFEDSALPEENAQRLRDAHIEHAKEVVRVHQDLLNSHGLTLSPDQVAENVVDVHASLLSVNGLTTQVTQILDEQEKSLQNRFITAPVGGDYNLDIILAAQLPEGVKFSDIVFIDGETDAKTGMILNEKNGANDQRIWTLKSPEDWHRALEDGLQMSQGAKNMYDHLEQVLEATDQHFGL